MEKKLELELELEICNLASENLNQLELYNVSPDTGSS